MYVKTKYVIVDGSAIVFSGAIKHSDMVGYGKKADGAGFVIIRTEFPPKYDDENVVVAKVYGRSDSLDVDNRGEIDEAIITRQICPSY
jgi:hypothetical protein